jgi:hypothetical protein
MCWSVTYCSFPSQVLLIFVQCRANKPTIIMNKIYSLTTAEDAVFFKPSTKSPNIIIVEHTAGSQAYPIEDARHLYRRLLDEGYTPSNH